MVKKKIPELRYRASRVCRVLGNPTAYELLYLLKKGKKTPDQLSKTLGVSTSAVSQVLRSLRQIDLVRYEVKINSRIYWIKYKNVIHLMELLEDLVTEIGVKEL